jgi:predicted alpha/beta superfamily hydrolase
MKQFIKSSSLLFTLLLVLLIFLPGRGYGFEKIDKYVIGEVVKIKSKVLGEDRIVFVSYPRGYSVGWQKYPVLYILGAGRGFPLAFSTVRFLSDVGSMPEMIVVGVSNTQPMRDLTLTKIARFPISGGGGKFTRFLTEELIPQIDKNYRTLPFRILSGHSLAGLLTTNILFTAPGTFSAYLTSSPWLPWDNGSFLKQSESLLKKHSKLNKFYFFSDSGEQRLKSTVMTFKSQLEKNAPAGLKWKHTVLKGEDHDSSVLQGLYKGLRWLYSGWKLTGQTMNNGLEAVKNHFKQLSRKYGYELNVPAQILNELGYRYLDSKKTKEAIPVFQYCTKLYPSFWFAYHNLGYCYQQLGDKKLAIENYEKSLKLNPKNEKAAQRLKELKK